MKLWTILKIAGRIFYVCVTLHILFFVLVFCVSEAINFAPDYTSYYIDGNGPNSCSDILAADVKIFFPILFYSFGKKALLHPSKFMRGYGIFGIVCLIWADTWIICVPKYVPWYQALAFTFVVLDICIFLELARYGICCLWKKYRKGKRKL